MWVPDRMGLASVVRPAGRPRTVGHVGGSAMLERLNQSLDVVERRLREDPAAEVWVSELARVAATSEYHYRRMFSALAWVPLSEYVRRRRLTLAAAEVLAGERSLLDVALRYGYGSGEAFARAFRAMHGVAPSEVEHASA